MRNKFDEQLDLLNMEMIKMGSLCELAITNAIEGLMEKDSQLLKIVKDADEEIDEKEREIEGLCLKLLLQQQPVARDLRVISSALKMISDMERIGDQAADICEIAKFIKNDQTKHHTHLVAMAGFASKMVRDAIRSFVDKDMALAHQVMREDDRVDREFELVKDDLINIIRDRESNSELCLDILMIAKYLERIGDHAVNIAEWVEFSITGRHLDDERGC